MKTLFSIFFFFAVVSIAFAAGNDTEDPVFRQSFILNLHIDKEHFYEEKFGKIPFVYNNTIYLFKGDEFGFNLDIQDNSIHKIKYQSDVKKADVILKFTQEVKPDGTAMMILHIRNNTKYILNMDALMTVPGKKEIIETSILPVQPELSSFESWPHPIVQLVLLNIKIAK